MARMERELPGLGEMGRELAERARERPWAAVGMAVAAGYLVGGGFFTRPTRWLVRAAAGAMAVPAVREQALEAWRRARRERAERPEQAAHSSRPEPEALAPLSEPAGTPPF